MTIGGIVLCGGRSSRMGRPKLSLPFGEEVLLQRVVRLLREVVAPVVVVAAPGQEVPRLPADVRLHRDDEEGRGPLAGLAVGLEALAGEAEAAYLTACDVPLLRPEFVHAVIDQLGECELAMPRDAEHHYPLAAVYRTTLATRVRSLLSSDRLRPVFLLEGTRANVFDVEVLRSVDPELASLRNLNTPQDYASACVTAGVPIPPSLSGSLSSIT